MKIGCKVTILDVPVETLNRQNNHLYDDEGDNLNFESVRGLSFIIKDETYSDTQINKRLYKLQTTTGTVIFASCYYFKEFWDILTLGYYYVDSTINGIGLFSSLPVIMDRRETIVRSIHLGTFDANGEYIPNALRNQIIVSIYSIIIPSDTELLNLNYTSNSDIIFRNFGYRLYDLIENTNIKNKKMNNIKLDTKYPLVKYATYDPNKGPIVKYGFILNIEQYNNLGKPIICGKEGNGIKIIKEFGNLSIINLNKIQNKDLNIILNTYFKAKVINADLSIKLFSNKNKKLNMLKESAEGKLFDISSYTSEYPCKKSNNEIHDIIELVHGPISLKFAYSDVELKCINLNGINIPKNRKIEKGAFCKIIRNKNLPIKLDTKVKVVGLNKTNKFIKNVIIRTENNDELVCHVKNLKRI